MMERDFERLAWPHLWTNLINERQRELFQNEIQARLRSGRYGF